MDDSIQTLPSVEEIGRVVAQSADQRLADVAREIVDKLDRGEFQVIDLSDVSSDHKEIVIWGVRHG